MGMNKDEKNNFKKIENDLIRKNLSDKPYEVSVEVRLVLEGLNQLQQVHAHIAVTVEGLTFQHTHSHAHTHTQTHTHTHTNP